MNKNKFFVLILLQMFMGSLILASSLSTRVNWMQIKGLKTKSVISETSKLLCPNTTIIPTIDGLMTPDEWNGAARYSFFFRPTSGHPNDYINIFLKHNDTHLFICYDVEPDDDNSTDDAGHLFLDLNNNGTRDILFLAIRSGQRFQNQVNMGNLSTLDYTVAFGFNLTAQESGRNHTIIEWIISINRASNYTGQNLTSAPSLPFGINPIGVIFGGYGTLSPEWLYGNQTNDDPMGTLDASFYADLELLAGPLPPSDKENLLPLLLSMQQGTGDMIIPIIIIIFGIVGAFIIFVFIKKRE